MSAADRPRVTLKIATSLDGRIATSTGQSQWITGEAARHEVQKLRAEHDAILVGAQTAIADNPMLTARTDPLPKKQPVRIVADSRLRTPLDSKLMSTVPPPWEQPIHPVLHTPVTPPPYFLIPPV